VVHLPIHQHHRILTVLSDEVWIMGDDHLPPISALFKKLILTLCRKTTVPHRRDLIDEIAVEFDNHRDRKGQPGAHSRGITDQRLPQIDSEFRELLDELNLILKRHIVDPADQTQIIETREIIVKGITKCDRPRHLHRASYLP
jgi:hypothetical protein